MRNVIMNDLKENLNQESLKNMILRGNGSEFYKGVTDDQKRRIHTQGCYIWKALLILEQHFIDKADINWRECYNKACKELISNHSGRTV